jgi:hypothetical protein
MIKTPAPLKVNIDSHPSGILIHIATERLFSSLESATTSESEPVGKASKQNQGGTKTGASSLLREQPGRYLLTGQAVSGAEQA